MRVYFHGNQRPTLASWRAAEYAASLKSPGLLAKALRRAAVTLDGGHTVRTGERNVACTARAGRNVSVRTYVRPAGVSKVRAPGLISVAGGRGGEAIYWRSARKKKKAHQAGDVTSRVYIDSVGWTCARGVINSDDE